MYLNENRELGVKLKQITQYYTIKTRRNFFFLFSSTPRVYLCGNCVRGGKKFSGRQIIQQIFNMTRCLKKTRIFTPFSEGTIKYI